MTARDERLLNDRALSDRARRGDRGAFEELFGRHGQRAWRFAVATGGSATTAEAAVANGFARAFATAPVAIALASPRAQLLEHVRHAAAAPDQVAELSPLPVLAAFQRMPELWRSVVWLGAVDGLASDEVAAALGVRRDDLPGLLARALTGLSDRALEARRRAVTEPACQQATSRLGDYAAGRVAGREAGRIRRHLDGCASCQGLLVELDDVVPVIRASVPDLPATVEPAALVAWRELLPATRGPVGIVLPGGRTVPVWAERAVAGAAAAVVAAGILSATVLAGRGGRSLEDRPAREVASGDIGLPDGESALGSTDEPGPTLDGPTGLTGGSGDSGSGLGDAGVPTTPSGPTAEVPGVSRSTTSTPGPGSDDGPTAGPGTDGPPTPAPTTPPTTAPQPLAEVTISVPGTLSVQAGDQCTGVDILGTTIGCVDGPDGTGSLEIGIGGSVLPPIELGL